MRKRILLTVSLLASIACAQSASAKPAPPLDALKFLVGEWEAAGHGSPGEGAGSFSFAFDLQDRVVVRKSRTDYPASAGRPAFSHDDLMLIYADESKRLRADYFDSEGHVIRYAAEFSADGRTLTFSSDPVPAQPRFRLTYVKLKDDTLNIKFEIAPPGSPENFKVYVEGSARKK